MTFLKNGKILRQQVTWLFEEEEGEGKDAVEEVEMLLSCTFVRGVDPHTFVKGPLCKLLLGKLAPPTPAAAAARHLSGTCAALTTL